MVRRRWQLEKYLPVQENQEAKQEDTLLTIVLSMVTKRKRKRRTIDIALRKQAENIFKDIERCKDGEEYFNKVKKKYLL